MNGNNDKDAEKNRLDQIKQKLKKFKSLLKTTPSQPKQASVWYDQNNSNTYQNQVSWDAEEIIDLQKLMLNELENEIKTQKILFNELLQQVTDMEYNTNLSCTMDIEDDKIEELKVEIRSLTNYRAELELEIMKSIIIINNYFLKLILFISI